MYSNKGKNGKYIECHKKFHTQFNLIISRQKGKKRNKNGLFGNIVVTRDKMKIKQFKMLPKQVLSDL